MDINRLYEEYQRKNNGQGIMTRAQFETLIKNPSAETINRDGSVPPSIKGKGIGDQVGASWVNPETGQRESGNVTIVGTPDQPYDSSMANQLIAQARQRYQ